MVYRIIRELRDEVMDVRIDVIPEPDDHARYGERRVSLGGGGIGLGGRCDRSAIPGIDHQPGTPQP
jgi:hypothetical protein